MLHLSFKDGTLADWFPNTFNQEWFYLVVVTNGPSVMDGGFLAINGISTVKHFVPGKVNITYTGGYLRINEGGNDAVHVDELTFWNRSLSPEEVGILYNSYV